MEDITAIELIQPMQAPFPERIAPLPEEMPEGMSVEDVAREPEEPDPSPLPADSGQTLDLFA